MQKALLCHTKRLKFKNAYTYILYDLYKNRHKLRDDIHEI